MKRIIICADGTWSKPDRIDKGEKRDHRHGKDWIRKPSNVVKMARAISTKTSDGINQIVYYDPGVGTGWGLLAPIMGGAFGQGVSKNILDCYRFLVQNYSEGDKIYLFGFSRGAFTVRSLAGFIHKSGLLEKEDAYYIPEAYEYYRLATDIDKVKSLIPRYTPKKIREKIISHYQEVLKKNKAEVEKFRTGDFKNRNTSAREIKIKFIGVWDTVGSLGIPVAGMLGHWINHRDAFHNLKLGSSVENAYQALSIDEKRKPFKPAIWEPENIPEQNVEQVWFAGVHTNIGGGYNDYRLENITFKWMVEKAKLHDLKFDEDYMEHIKSSYAGVLRKSMSLFYFLFFGGGYSRPIGKVPNGHETVHSSVIERHEDKTKDYGVYGPKNLLKYLGED